ncbi:ADP-ribose pyrophosphatase [Thermus oshimai JL-2]|uniref:ADP-ribose pyrophosphatase n=1 Tax=Thermus oshimai JL-2 TaxID=751945 RepID=K7QTD2_THEOS|nr:NUDIX domain-containing protein [Thermus oshimai]AFV75106.1 ADP-ribose pyrophosphatase [Thermus oshimai JL-2]
MAVPLLGTHLLLTRRSPHLPTHAGQVAFPGGVVEAGEGVVEAALREAEEEVGLRGVEPLGFLSPTLSPQGFLVQPVVVYREDLPPLRPSPKEVAELLLAPLEELLLIRPWSEERFGRRVWHYPWRGVDIWGVTGNILREFLEVWRGAHRDSPGGPF